MAGRAGRRGLDVTGTVVVLIKGDMPTLGELTSVMQGMVRCVMVCMIALHEFGLCFGCF